MASFNEYKIISSKVITRTYKISIFPINAPIEINTAIALLLEAIAVYKLIYFY